jgi:hypothetical protein
MAAMSGLAAVKGGLSVFGIWLPFDTQDQKTVETYTNGEVMITEVPATHRNGQLTNQCQKPGVDF